MRQFLLAISLLIATPTYADATKYLFAQPNASGAPSIVLSNDTVQASGMTPTGDVVLFTASVASRSGIPAERTGARVFRDEDRDGVITYRSRHGISPHSVWIAVDVQTGLYALATPATFAVRPLPPQVLRRDVGGVLPTFDVDQASAELLVVRPLVGAWRVRALDGEQTDADQTRNGKLSLGLQNALVIAGTAGPPSRLQIGDIVAIIDPSRLAVLVIRIGTE